MDKTRLEDHVRQMVLNLKYDYDEGRLSAIGLVLSALEKFPSEFVDEYAQMFFLPLVLQLVNDDSKACREKCAGALSRLLCRASTDVVKRLYEYSLRWSTGSKQIQRTSLQVFGIFVDSNVEFLKHGDTASSLVDRLSGFLEVSDKDSWEIPYFALLCLAKLVTPFPSLLLHHAETWDGVIENLDHTHVWVKLAASRLLESCITPLDHESLDEDIFLIVRQGSLFQLARALCRQIAIGETEQSTELIQHVIKNLTWVAQAMMHNPELCFSKNVVEPKEKKPLKWLMTRLSQVAKPKDKRIRDAVFKCFAAFCHVGGEDLVRPHLELLLEPLHRSILESEGMKDAAGNTKLSEEATLARDVMNMLEECCDSTEEFLKAYAAVKTRAQDKKIQRKEESTSQAVVDPEAATSRKIKKHQQERKRRKRKIEERRNNRGGTQKRHHL
mmetsp:Transcript_29703/g.68602  ORF Transcript_29703/g.68602 Transcript_29703/m.68602 type:complete len:442 (-) Transcript_29703:1273-2598(-)